MLANFRLCAPPEFRSPTLLDDLGLPRYWAYVWASFLPADLAPSIIAKKLNHLETFYQHADELLAPRRLDDAMADVDVEALSNALDGFFLTLRNRPSITPVCEERWQTALQFVLEIVQRLTRNHLAQHLDELHGRYMRLELLHSKLRIGRRRRPEQVRSL